MKWIIVVGVICLLVGANLGAFFNSKTIYVYNHSNPDVRIIKQTELVHVPIPGNISYTTIRVPAVDDQGKGVVTEISVQVLPGTGKTLTNIDKILFWVDTQNSIRTARDVAKNVTGVDINKFDVIYTIKANATIIEGPSAGAALTIATAASLLDKDIDPNIMITGTIDSEGNIGPVGGVDAKILAAKENGATIILVPKGMGTTTLKEKVETCETVSGQEYCRVDYVDKKTDATQKYGIEVKEVTTIREAMDYFLL